MTNTETRSQKRQRLREIERLHMKQASPPLRTHHAVQLQDGKVVRVKPLDHPAFIQQRRAKGNFTKAEVEYIQTLKDKEAAKTIANTLKNGGQFRESNP